MIYNDAVQQALDQSYANTKDTQVTIVKLATVKQIVAGQGAKVQFYGETSQSTKVYPYIDGYLPEVNDKVALIPQANTYIILGKVTSDFPEQRWADIDHRHDDLYLPLAYANKLSDGTKTIELSAAGFIPNSNKVIDLGSSAYQYKAGYFQNLYLNGVEFIPANYSPVGHKHDDLYLPLDHASKLTNGTREVELFIPSGYSSVPTLQPNTTGAIDLGSASREFKNAYVQKLFLNGTEFDPTPIIPDQILVRYGSTNYTLSITADSSKVTILPSTDARFDLGNASYGFRRAHFGSFEGAWAYNVDGTSSSGYAIQWENNTTVSPSTTNTVDLGSATHRFKTVRAQDVVSDTLECGKIKGPWHYSFGTSSVYYNIDWASNTDIVPSTTNVVNLGNTSKEFRNVHAKRLLGQWGYYADGYTLASRYLYWDNTTTIIPDSTGQVNLGTSNRELNNLYAKNVYNNGTAVTSDRRKKKGIKGLIKKYVSMFWKLRPVSYKYKDGDSGRTHTGYIAQEVEQAALDSGLTLEDLAAVVIDEQGSYSLRYNELIAIQHAAILELKERLDKMETELNKLKNKEV